MEDLWFYIQLGLHHVLDLGAYDHILFLSALAIPFTFKNWRRVLVLATIFTIAHCTSLALSAYGLVRVNVSIIEFLIPVTIILMAAFDLSRAKRADRGVPLYLHAASTAFFGLIHGFGFSNYFNMLMAERDDKLNPLVGFAMGIELSQVTIILCVLVLAFVCQNLFKVKQSVFITVCSLLVILITIPLLIETFPV